MKPEESSEYKARIGKALNYIEQHLMQDLSLEKVSQIAYYSPFHFHRIFKAITNETLNQYIIRRRVEKAAAVLMKKSDAPISTISQTHGFSSNSTFTRAFKNFYGISPLEFRKQSPGRFSKIRKEESKNGQRGVSFDQYICNIDNHLKWIEMNAKIEVKELPEMSLAFIPHIGVEGIAGVFEKLIRWSTPKGYMENPETKMMIIYHDSFRITEADKVRMSIAMTVPLSPEKEGEISAMKLEKGKFVVGHFRLPPDGFEKAWSGLFIWLNEKGYKKSNRDSFTIVYNDSRKDPQQMSTVDLCIPIESH